MMQTYVQSSFPKPQTYFVPFSHPTSSQKTYSGPYVDPPLPIVERCVLAFLFLHVYYLYQTDMRTNTHTCVSNWRFFNIDQLPNNPRCLNSGPFALWIHGLPTPGQSLCFQGHGYIHNLHLCALCTRVGNRQLSLPLSRLPQHDRISTSIKLTLRLWNLLICY